MTASSIRRDAIGDIRELVKEKEVAEDDAHRAEDAIQAAGEWWRARHPVHQPAHQRQRQVARLVAKWLQDRVLDFRGLDPVSRGLDLEIRAAEDAWTGLEDAMGGMAQTLGEKPFA